MKKFNLFLLVVFSSYVLAQEVPDSLLREAYERMQYDIRASHILIRVDKNTNPADTLTAFNKIYEIRKRIVEGGEDFNAVAEEVSEDPSARDKEASGFQPHRKGNRGDIGYFTVFDMVLPFENAAYNLKENEISYPFRTDFGYHLVMLSKKQPALGEVQVAHLFIQIPADANHADSLRLLSLTDSLYTALKAGADWDKLVKEFSDDKSSSINNGILPWFGSNRMVPAFIDGTRTISDIGEISEPALTSYGWHIIKLIDKKPIGTYQEEKSSLSQSILKASGYNLTRVC